MLSLDTIFVPRWWKKFSEATGARIPLPPRILGRNAAREDFLLPSEYFPTRLCIMCGKYSRTPRMKSRGSGGPHAHSTLCCERIGL